ncbi:MAG: hypothetical protein ACN4GZ_02065 [Acidimicrobiales bacterium]
MIVQPVPTEEEAVAIAAALTVVFNGGGVAEEPLVPSTSWRFSGRRWGSQRFGIRTTR